jgi:hypothetical protein
MNTADVPAETACPSHTQSPTEVCNKFYNNLQNTGNNQPCPASDIIFVTNIRQKLGSKNINKRHGETYI